MTSQNCADLRLDIYGRVKLINYVRSRSADQPATVASDLQKAAAGPRASWPWNGDQYFTPVVAEDPLLCSLGDADDDDVAMLDDAEEDATVAAARRAAGAAEGETSGGAEAEALLETVAQMRSEMAVLLGLNEDVQPEESDDEKEELPDVSADGSAATSASKGTPLGAGFVEWMKDPNAQATAKAAVAAGKGLENAATEGQYGSADGDSSGYFDSYARLSIHEDMLSDKIRTLGYREAIDGNAHLFKDKIVLDVGCGTGILSMIAAKAGAKHVIGVDASGIIEHAKRIVSDNGLTEKITLLRGTMESVKLPFEKVDIILSEWMGYALLYESMLPSVLWARDKYLSKDGIVLPTSCTMEVSLSSNDRLGFWDDVYGFKMAALRDHGIKDAMIEVVPPETNLSTTRAPFTSSTARATMTPPSTLPRNSRLTRARPARCAALSSTLTRYSTSPNAPAARRPPSRRRTSSRRRTGSRRASTSRRRSLWPRATRSKGRSPSRVGLSTRGRMT